MARYQDGDMLIAGGDLYRALHDHDGDHLDSPVCWHRKGQQIIMDVAHGLFYLHSRDVVHLDLKVRTSPYAYGQVCSVQMLKRVLKTAFGHDAPGFLWRMGTANLGYLGPSSPNCGLRICLY